METNGCFFPDELEYSPDMNIWFRKVREGLYSMGMTAAILWTAGKPLKLVLRKKGDEVPEGKSIGSVEGRKYFDVLRMPFSCRIVEINREAGNSITPSTRSIYGVHWLAIVEATQAGDAPAGLLSGAAARKAADEKVISLRLQCFSELPDTEMVEIGSECSAVLARLSQIMEGKQKGYAVHLVTDDITSPMEMVRWSDESGNRLAETRKVDNIYHFIAVRA